MQAGCVSGREFGFQGSTFHEAGAVREIFKA